MNANEPGPWVPAAELRRIVREAPTDPGLLHDLAASFDEPDPRIDWDLLRDVKRHAWRQFDAPLDAPPQDPPASSS